MFNMSSLVPSNYKHYLRKEDPHLWLRKLHSASCTLLRILFRRLSQALSWWYNCKQERHTRWWLKHQLIGVPILLKYNDTEYNTNKLTFYPTLISPKDRDIDLHGSRSNLLSTIPAVTTNVWILGTTFIVHLLFPIFSCIKWEQRYLFCRLLETTKMGAR